MAAFLSLEKPVREQNSLDSYILGQFVRKLAFSMMEDLPRIYISETEVWAVNMPPGDSLPVLLDAQKSIPFW